MRIQLRVDGGRIQETRLFTDALDVELTERAEKCLSGLMFQKKAVRDAIDGIPTDNEMQARMKKDICGLMESFF